MKYMKDNTKWYYEQQQQQKNIIVTTFTIINLCLDAMLVTEEKP